MLGLHLLLSLSLYHFALVFGCSELVRDLGDLWTKRCPGFFLSSHGRVCVALIGKKMG
jgi:hypothetical protein